MLHGRSLHPCFDQIRPPVLLEVLDKSGNGWMLQARKDFCLVAESFTMFATEVGAFQHDGLSLASIPCLVGTRAPPVTNLFAKRIALVQNRRREKQGGWTFVTMETRTIFGHSFLQKKSPTRWMCVGR